MRLPHSLEALAQRRFRLLFTGRTISSFGTSMAEIALAFAVLDIGGPSDLGLVILAREIPIVVLLLIGGVWGDRLPRHLVLAGSDFVRGATQAFTAVLLLTGNASVLSIAVLAAIFGGASAFGRPAYQGPRATDRSRHTAATGERADGAFLQRRRHRGAGGRRDHRHDRTPAGRCGPTP